MAGFADHTILSYSPVRTAIGAFNGALNDTPATKLGTLMMRENCGNPASILPPSARS